MATYPDNAASASARASVIVTVAGAADLSDVLLVQRAAFGRVAKRLGIDPSEMAPLRETQDDLIRLYESGVVTFIARSGPAVAGTVRAVLRDDGVIEIGRLAVGDAFVRRGVATALMLTIEEHLPEVSRFELYTGVEAVEPLALYDRLGYRIFRTEEYPSWRMVWLGRDRPSATATDDAPLHS